MADQKISQLSSGTNAQAGDLFVIARGASNFNLTTAQLFNAPSAAATFASLTVDTDTLFVDATNNRVGIKQATPLHQLHVGTSDLILNASGNLGLGVTPSAWASIYRAMQVGQAGTLFGMTNDQDRVGLTSNAYFDTTDSRWEYIGTGTAMRYEQDGGAHSWHTAASGTANAAISFTQAMALNASGGLQTLNTIGVGNTTPATSGAGISFPATQSASSDVNTLDDYEEGTWVPTLTNLTLGNAVTAFRYVKVGQMVTLDISIEWGSTTSASGQWRISLPFNAQATGGGSAYLYDDTGSEYVVPATVYTASFGQTLVIGSGSGAGFVTNTAPFTWAQNDRFGCSITYRATT